MAVELVVMAVMVEPRMRELGYSGAVICCNWEPQMCFVLIVRVVWAA